MHKETEIALDVKFYLDFHWVTRTWWRRPNNGSDVKYVFPLTKGSEVTDVSVDQRKWRQRRISAASFPPGRFPTLSLTVIIAVSVAPNYPNVFCGTDSDSVPVHCSGNGQGRGPAGRTCHHLWICWYYAGHEQRLNADQLEPGNCHELLREASYESHTLYDLIYTMECYPKGWEEFFQTVETKIQTISDSLKQDTDNDLGLNPKIGWVFRAFHMVPLDKVKVVIMGQDPAPQPGLATGLSFSLKPEVPAYKVPSVQRVLLEARNEGFCINETNGDLIPWAKQGVLLLNTALTLIDNEIGSHIPLWRDFTKDVFNFINENANPSVWILWGSKAKAFATKIDTSKHFILSGGHPSPLAPAHKFFCQNYFACANNWLKKQGRGEVDWNLASEPCEKHESRLFGRRWKYPGYSEKDKCEMKECSVKSVQSGNNVTNENDQCGEILEKASYSTHTLFDVIYTKKCQPKGWEEFFKLAQPKIQEISDRLEQETSNNLGLNPKIGWVFRAFHMVPLDKVKVVIMGQDPAPQPGLATGLSFSLKPEVPAYKVPSVQRVLLEARNEGFCINETNGDLIPWAKQGVLLLNTALTLIDNEIGSHIPLWRDFTKDVFNFINENANPSVWILWGSKAKAFSKKIDTSKHFILSGGHPSPLAPADKFFCQNYFACANNWLRKQGRGEVDWNLASEPCEKHESRLFGRRWKYPGYSEKDKCEMRECSVKSVESENSGNNVTNENDQCGEILEKASYSTHTLFDVIYTKKCQPKGWEEFFKLAQPKIQEISDRLEQETSNNLGLNPKIGWVFRAFHMVPLDKVKVVIIGQDPAPQPGLATGLSFSLKPEVPAYSVPNTQRVLLEARNEGFCVNEANGNLIPWAKQGVLLLNTALTTTDNKAASHIRLWRDFTKEVLAYISENANPSVWILWGSKAKGFAKKIDTSRHFVIEGGSPSPQASAAKFFCRNYFACANSWLKQQGKEEVDWNLAAVPCEKYESRLFTRKHSYPGYYERSLCTMKSCAIWTVRSLK